MPLDADHRKRRLKYQVRQATRVLWSLLRQSGYFGRIQATLWHWHGQGEAFDYGIAGGIDHGYHGQVIMTVEDSWE